VVVDRLRSRRAAKRGGGAAVVSIEEAPPNVTEQTLVDLAASPESELLARESRRHLLGCCRAAHEGEHLERDVEIFELAVLEGWTSREIATGYDLKVSSIDSVVHRQRCRIEARGVAVPRR
jgi:DNA-directed RNA polymerase specialized sigma24 family protein